MIKSILVICVGNICRSPMAEAALRHTLPHLDIFSAGLSALVGQPAAPDAVEVMRERGFDITTHRAQQLESWMLAKADLVLVMEMEHKHYLEGQHPFLRGKIYRLCNSEGIDINDPYQQGHAAFEEAVLLVTRGVESWVNRIRTMELEKPKLANDRNCY